jgi:hypothetical protein
LVPQLAGEQHETLYSLQELHDVANKCGFEVDRVVMVNTIAPWVAIISPRIARSVHRWETRKVRRHGTIMIVALTKPEGGDG